MNEKNKSLSKNASYNVLYNVMNIIFPLITIPYLSRILLADGLGKINFVRNIVSWFILFSALGIPRYGVREIARIKNNKNELNRTVYEIIIINFVSTLICTIIFVFIIFNNNFFEKDRMLYIITGIQLILNIFNVDWFYQGIEEYRYITQRSFFIKVISFICMFIFVREKDDYIVYAFLQSLAVAGNYIFNFYYLKKYIKLTFIKPRLRVHLKPIFILFSTQLAISVYALLDTTMLGLIKGDEVVGYYSNCHKVINVIAVLTASINAVLLPYFVKNIRNNEENKVKLVANKILKYIIFICIPIVTGLILISKQITLLYFGKGFECCIITLQLFSPFILFTTIGNLYGTQLLMAYQQEKKLMISVFVGAIVNFILNLLLIPKISYNGAVIASVITEMIVMFLQILFTNKYIKLKLSKNLIFSILVSNAILILYVCIINRIINSLIISIIFDIIGSVMIYFVINYILKNEIIMELIIYIKEKYKNE